MSTILTNSVIEWHKIKCFRVDTASLGTFHLRRSTRLAFMSDTRLAFIMLIEWAEFAVVVSREAYRVDIAGPIFFDCLIIFFLMSI